jgi:hypothetical protein
MIEFITKFRDLPYNVIFTALEKEEKDEITGSMLYRPSLPGKAISGELPSFFDELFRLILINSEKKSDRFFLTENTGSSLAKDRSGKLERTEPPNWNYVMKKIYDAYFNSPQSQQPPQNQQFQQSSSSPRHPNIPPAATANAAPGVPGKPANFKLEVPQ